MKRVHIICEGQTEETFVNELLRPHLFQYGIYPSASLIGRPGHKGGRVTTHRMTYDIKRRLLGDPAAWCTTFFDFYGLDSSFVGRQEADSCRSFKEKAVAVEVALSAHIINQTDDNVIRRFLPYIQMYEFEGLLFSDPVRLASGLYASQLERDFAAIRAQFETPEQINDNRETAPSKRILQLMPSYDKPVGGTLAAIEIGLDQMRRECKRFDSWVTRLEALA